MLTLLPFVCKSEEDDSLSTMSQSNLSPSHLPDWGFWKYVNTYNLEDSCWGGGAGKIAVSDTLRKMPIYMTHVFLTWIARQPERNNSRRVRKKQITKQLNQSWILFIKSSMRNVWDRIRVNMNPPARGLRNELSWFQRLPEYAQGPFAVSLSLLLLTWAPFLC